MEKVGEYYPVHGSMRGWYYCHNPAVINDCLCDSLSLCTVVSLLLCLSVKLSWAR